jgi:hypothetical protein
MNCPFCKAIVKITGKYGKCTNCGKSCVITDKDTIIKGLEERIYSQIHNSRMLEEWCRTLEEKVIKVHTIVKGYRELLPHRNLIKMRDDEWNDITLEDLFIRLIERVVNNETRKNAKTVNLVKR